MRDKVAIIVGAGPAGLSAAYYLLQNTADIMPLILEEQNDIGGISRTFEHNGYKFEIGPHRLFSKNQEVLDFLQAMLPNQGVPALDDKVLKRQVSLTANGPDPDKTDRVMLKRKRVSRIFYLRKFFDYPISIKLSTIANLGIVRTINAGLSYIKSRLFQRDEKTLEDFMINRFGFVLYKMFFEHYTQKVWGLHPKDISKEWGEQRIKGLSLSKAILNAIVSPFKRNSDKNKETSLIDEFLYPKYGCGQLWHTIADDINSKGGKIKLNCKVIGINLSDGRVDSVKVVENGEEKLLSGDYFISSMPIKDLVIGMGDIVPKDVKSIAENLPYRDYNLVGLCVNKILLSNNTDYPTINNICPDHWIYIQDTDVTAGRIYLLNNWSPYILKDFQNKVFICLEYFCNEGDNIWNMSDDEAVDFGISELERLNVIYKSDVVDSVRLKVRKAYPAYFGVYKDFDTVKKYLNAIENLYCIGRNGQHKYNNMDHSILSGFEVGRVLMGKSTKESLWQVNTEKEYHEIKQ